MQAKDLRPREMPKLFLCTFSFKNWTIIYFHLPNSFTRASQLYICTYLVWPLCLYCRKITAMQRTYDSIRFVLLDKGFTAGGKVKKRGSFNGDSNLKP